MKINYLLASMAVVAGLSAAFTNHAEKTGLYPTWKFEKERQGSDKIHFISAPHLADLIYSKQQDLILVDLQSDTAYVKYHIPSAIQFEQMEKLIPGKPGVIVVYGTDQNWEGTAISDKLLEDQYVLKGGIQQWYDLVLFPDFEKFQVRNKDQLEEIISKSRYFGGSPRNLLELNIDQRSSQFREGC